MYINEVQQSSQPGSPVGADAPISRAPQWLVQPFEPISLAQLNAKADMLERRDNKYIISASVLERAMGELARHFDILEIDGKRDFTYDTCYFDDAAHSDYFDHHRGRRIRTKVRMRKYVDANLCFVEVKLKHMRGMTIKERLQRPVHMHGTMDDEARQFVANSYRDLYGRDYDRQLRSTLSMRYQRVTLVAKQGGERMTVDLGVTFDDAGQSLAVNSGTYLVETKSDKANGIADKILRSLHQHPTNSCSKYCVAAAALGRVPKFNKFLVPLRQLGMVPPASSAAPLPRAPQPLHRKPTHASTRRPRAGMRARALTGSLMAVLALAASFGFATSSSSATPAASRYALPVTNVDGLGIGEISGLAWDADEQLLHAVSDQGKLIGLRVERDGARLLAVKPVAAKALVDEKTGVGKPSSGKRFNAEGLAVQNASNGRRGDSRLVVALEEKPPQIARFDPAGALQDRLAVPPPADDMANYRKKGRGLESVAMHPEHGVITAPEAPLQGRPSEQHTVYAKGRAWSFARHDADSRLKGIDVLADGNLLVLERTRPGKAKDEQVASLRRVDIANCGAQNVCKATLVATLPPGPQNYEGMTLLDARHALIASDNGGDAATPTTFALIALP